MRRLLAAAPIAALALAIASVAAAAPPDRPLKTPRAKPGSELAKRSSITRGRLRRGLAKQLRDFNGAKGAWVRDLDAPNDAGLFSRNARAERILASNQKLFTTTAAVEEE